MFLTKRIVLYFLMYPILGPLVGYVVVVAGFATFLIVDKGFYEASLQLRSDALDVLLTVGFAYIFGGVQAIITGLYAARALAKHGKSRLVTALKVATIASICAVMVIALAEGVKTLRLIVFMLPPALISTIVIHSLERYFRMPTVQAKS